MIKNMRFTTFPQKIDLSDTNYITRIFYKNLAVTTLSANNYGMYVKITGDIF